MIIRERAPGPLAVSIHAPLADRLLVFNHFDEAIGQSSRKLGMPVEGGAMFVQTSAMATLMMESIVYFGTGSLLGALLAVALSLPVTLPVVNRRARRRETSSASQLVELGRGDAIKRLKIDLGALSDRLRATEEELKVKTTAAREAQCALPTKNRNSRS
jgi:hypothetical protein